VNNLDDCFRVTDAWITVAEAIERFSRLLGGVSQMETVPIRDCLARILAVQLTAKHNIPPYDNSAVDGYAVYFDDLNKDGETRLPVKGRIAAGHPLNKPAKRHEALNVFTGAPLPKGFADEGPDTIFMLEDIKVDGDVVILPPGIKRFTNFRNAGEDVKINDVVLPPGHKLRPQDVSMAASLGYVELEVYRRLRVAVFSSGDEIQDVGTPLHDGCIYDANRYSLFSMLQGLGCEVTDIGILPDKPMDIRDGLREASLNHDLLITSGGVSKGEEDHIKSVVEELGALNVWNLAIKPGRPIALGHIKRDGIQVPFIGLPGNPVAVMVTFIRIARPLVLLLSGARDFEPQLYQVKAGFDFKKKVGRREWLRASLERDENGEILALKYLANGSGIISSMVASGGLIELSEECEAVKQGDLVSFLSFKEVM
jgi:molybdopterin molybdotransferase